MGFDGAPIASLQAQFDEVDGKIKSTLDNMKLLGNASALLVPLLDTTQQTAVEFDNLAKATARALDFSKYADQVGGADSTRSALSELKGRLSDNQAGLAKRNLPSDRSGILETLRGPVEDPKQKQLLEDTLNLYSAVEKAEKKLTDEAAQAGKQRLTDIAQEFAEKKALGEASRKDEEESLNKQIAAAKALGEAGNADYVRLLEDRKNRKAEWAKEDLETTKDALEQQLAVSKGFVERLEAEGAPRGEIIAAYDRMIKRLEDWRDAHGPVLKANKELAQQVSSTLTELGNDRAGEKTKLLDDNLKALKDSMKAIGDEAQANALKLGESVTNAQKLEVIDRQIELAKKAQGTSAKEVAEHDKILADLAQQRLQLEQTITVAKLRQAGKENQLGIESLRQEIELLQIRKEQGLKVDDQLIAKSAELREARLKDLELTYQAERETADDKVAVEREYQIARKNLEQEFTLDRAREAAKRVDVAKSEAKATKDARKAEADDQPRRGSSDQNGPYSSGINFSGIQTGQGPQLREQRAERDAARHEAFLRANPLAVQKVAEIDRARAEEQAKREAKRLEARGIKNPFDALTGAGGSAAPPSYQLPSVPEQLRAASPGKILKDAGENASSGPKETIKTTNVNNNQTYTINVNNNGRSGSTENVYSDEAAIRAVRKAMDYAAMFNGGPGAMF